MIRRWIMPLLVGIALAAIARQITLIETPCALMALAVHRVGKAGGMNQMSHAPLATAAARTIVRPSPDLAYSSCPFDLSKGPLLVEATPVAAPYWSLSIFDAKTNAVFVRNDRDGRLQPVRIMVKPRGSRIAVPDGTTLVNVDGNTGIVLIRILIDKRASFPSIDRARRSARCGLAPYPRT
jgi:uncharacterized membrane protein